MDDSIKTYKCPNCGAALTFDSKTQKLHCSHCDTSIDVEAMKALPVLIRIMHVGIRLMPDLTGLLVNSKVCAAITALHVVQNLSLMRQQLLLPVPPVVLLSYCLTI